jgi:hypothetical protein
LPANIKERGVRGKLVPAPLKARFIAPGGESKQDYNVLRDNSLMGRF